MAKEYHSKYKDWIMNYFRALGEKKVSARELFSAMTEAGMNINLVTVYRNLDRLAADGVLAIRRSAVDDGKFYQYLRPKMECDRHLHLYCRRCGKIIHLNCDFMEEIQAHLRMDHGFAVDCDESTIVGLCKRCQAASAEQAIAAGQHVH